MFQLRKLSNADGERLRDELARQYRVIRSEFVMRLVLVGLIYALCGIYVSPAIIFSLYMVEIGGEFISQALLKGLDPVKSPTRYSAFLLSLVPMEAALITAAGLVWLQDDPYSKAVAIGIVMGSLLHLCSVRSIHLALGIVGMVSVGVVVLIFNTIHWISLDNWTGLAITTPAALAALTYAAVTMLTNYRLHRASAEATLAARASNVAKGRFLAQISHELRTPLNAVIGLSEIEAGSAAGASRQRLQTVVTSARDLAVMLDDALDYSALTEGRVSITPRPSVMRRDLAALIFMFEVQAKRQGRELLLTVDKDVPAVLTMDSQRLRQCLGNLIGNALKHASRGPIAIMVRHSRSRLVIEVSDQGRGIPQAQRERVFEPFFRGSAESPGVGLGLSISRTLARQMSGDLVLLPSAVGAVFRLTILAPEASVAVESPKPTSFEGRTILVVDDIATNRLVAAQLLIASGARVVEAASGPEALARLEKGGVDAVLLDLMMPGMDGIETLRRVRSMPGPRMPVVAMTADVLAERSEALPPGLLDGFLPKPILPETLRDVLGPILQRD
jgi:two-component system, sensor histidine kinase